MTRSDDSLHAAPQASDDATLSSVERVKRDSRQLRGRLHETVTDGLPAFSDEDAAVLKFHGIYQQDDRDRRVKRGEPTDPSWQMMIRLTIPGGVLTAAQYLALDALADEVGNGTLRITTRQSIQYHGVPKQQLKPLLQRVHAVMLTSLAACGDVSRNVMASASPMADAAHRDVQAVARGVADVLRPQSNAYAEVWLDGERVSDTRDEEPIYGASYLPRKFKVGVAIDSDNAVDIYSYDCGLVAITDQDRVRGYNLLVGGGFGMTHNKPATFARLATPIAFVAPEHAVDAVRAVCELYRDHGNRSNRKQARLKYLVESWGADRVLEVLRSYVEFPLHPPVALALPRQDDLLGLHPQGDGKWFVGAYVENGRILDRDNRRTRHAFREIVRRLEPEVRLTPMQGIVFAQLSPGGAAEALRILGAHGVPTERELTPLRRYALACPALPTCGLSLAESERALPGVLDSLAPLFAELGIDDVPLTVRMTGCPNGCARPYNADIGFVGRRPGVYHVFVGGGLRGDRLSDLFLADVKVEQIAEQLRPLLLRYAAEREADESVGDYYQRAMARDHAHAGPRRLLTGQETPTALAFHARRR